MPQVRANAAGAAQSVCFQRAGRLAMRGTQLVPRLVELLGSEEGRVAARAVGALHNVSSDAEAIRIVRRCASGLCDWGQGLYIYKLVLRTVRAHVEVICIVWRRVVQCSMRERVQNSQRLTLGIALVHNDKAACCSSAAIGLSPMSRSLRVLHACARVSIVTIIDVA